MDREEPAGRLLRWGVIALFVALVADLVEDLVDPANTDKAKELFEAAADHPDRLVISAFFLLATAAIIPAVFWLTRDLHARGRVAARIASVLAVMGALGHAALAALYLIIEQMPEGGSSPQEMIRLIDRVNNSDAFGAAVAPLVISFPLALIVTFIALHRAGVSPRWAVWFPLAAVVVAIAEPFSTQASTATALGLILVALAGLAARVFRRARPVIAASA